LRTCKLAVIALEMPDHKDHGVGFLFATLDSDGVVTHTTAASLLGEDEPEQITSSTLEDIRRARSVSKSTEAFGALSMKELDRMYSYQTCFWLCVT
jgi:hypothetical protein